MRDAMKINETTVVTIDNSGCIGEKRLDAVQVSNTTAAYYSARVALLEQWCAGAEPTHIFISNFTGEYAWFDYEKGIEWVFDEIEKPLPPIKGSTESNFESLQSGLGLMMIGQLQYEVSSENCEWYVLGKPLVGQEVIEQPQNVAKLKEMYFLVTSGIAKTIWPVGSKGIGAELKRIFPENHVECKLDLEKTSGPATAVIVGISRNRKQQFKNAITVPYEPILIR
ncbi:hypothetical protein D1B33_06585 [Lysinibacillus yapensis]|uniref:Alpha-ribazole-5-phosphate synthase n=1 Tax=Ureibacillus yapensis TaxID=2304605 RepID=A0A396SQT8_9BACL|nr:hypothetical protein [Lysinibacillus yapensis]RHW38539.1 hypothetical protein D1B33_06585 [Lysinibacillus yapensis]